MTPEVIAQLDRIEGRVQAIDDRTRQLEIRLAGKDGAEKTWRRCGEVARWAVAVIVAFVAGHVGGTH